MKKIYSILLMIIFLSSCSSSSGNDDDKKEYPSLSLKFSSLDILKNTSSETYRFYVKYQGNVVPNATVTASSNNETLLDAAGIVITSNDTLWTLKLVPKSNQTGQVTITFSVNYNNVAQNYNVTINVLDAGSYSTYISEGWAAFKAKDYFKAINKFKFAEFVGPDSAEGKIGLGWGRLMNDESDSSYIAFNRAAQLLNSQLAKNSVNLDRDFQMGMTFAANAVKQFNISTNYGRNITYYTQLDSLPRFKFTHDTTITEHHVALTMAQNYFAVGSYIWAYRYINRLTDKTNFNPDYNTAAGRRELADEIERLFSIL